MSKALVTRAWDGCRQKYTSNRRVRTLFIATRLVVSTTQALYLRQGSSTAIAFLSVRMSCLAMAAFQRDTPKCRWTARRVIVTALAAFSAISQIQAQAAPGDFELWGTATGAKSVEVVVFVPEKKNGPLDLCYGTLSGPDEERHFSCDDHGGKSSTITLKGLQPETEYNCTVTFANLLDDCDCDEAATTRSILITTQAEPTEPDPSATTGPNPTEAAAAMVSLPTPIGIIFCVSTLLALGQRHLNNYCIIRGSD
ncbi:uncharacterized protein LOC119463438 [Dermacentor silvarum]|uniref:uncharacterized protein LOC119463438 n=1 Tax=Dermacentor silvarum TaxID=543639 RepID=UPI001896E06C|nr:uncharacterized protein LOC119463438 [Dermacentor silvarum]